MQGSKLLDFFSSIGNSLDAHELLKLAQPTLEEAHIAGNASTLDENDLTKMVRIWSRKSRAAVGYLLLEVVVAHTNESIHDTIFTT